MKQETQDFKRLEDAVEQERTGQISLVDLIRHTERARRVTWRMGIAAAGMCLLLLLLSGAVDMSHAVTAGAVSWIWITAALNFRAFHVEDGTTAAVLRRVELRGAWDLMPKTG